ncbi:MAG TPA: biotin--[acetyl-CoA-carboxylase] ligase [Ferruginibacter sp.]|nr:biotin--[acetyl-CoA-carboxylase] ligase [Ferruginibacter sp.]HMP19932.1 biotin--[acetyl-CoA-carboxylase] ligase [Ferruginibacter sp.]
MSTKPAYLFTLLSEVDSTNNYAMAQAHAGLAEHGQAFFALQQTEGKGQRGKSWYSGAGENIALSIVLAPQSLAVSKQFRLSMAVALGCYRFFKKFAGDETSIKWPNDIYWRDRKAGGILIENVIGKNEAGPLWKFAIAGIGLNINQVHFHDALPNPVSLKQITGKAFSPQVLARELQLAVLDSVHQLTTIPFSQLQQQYNNTLYKINQPVLLKKGNIIFETTIKGVTPEGLLHTTDLVDNYFNFGEVEWVK